MLIYRAVRLCVRWRDVYKRQIVRKVARSVLTYKRYAVRSAGEILPLIINNAPATTTIKSVSYTHLDVYKRQAENLDLPFFLTIQGIFITRI